VLRKKPLDAFPELFFNRRPMIVGLTGGIGSGKTTIANELRNAGVPVYIADDQAKKMLDTPQVTKAVVEAFGDVTTEGRIDRAKLAAIVFDNPQKLQQLNAIVHPAVKEDFKEWVASHREHPILVREAAVLFESGTHKDCDYVIT